MYTYARINKETLKFIREQKGITLEYVARITKHQEAKIVLWEDGMSEKFPTINQAKKIAKCYRVPFAGLYMNSSDIEIKHLPKVRNLRTLPDTTIDNSALNLAIYDVLNARELLIETKKTLKETIPMFVMSHSDQQDVIKFAEEIRSNLGLKIEVQYRCNSTRQLYLYVRNLVEEAGVFVHCFAGIDTDIVRGFAIYEDLLPIIGLNNEDRYPAKTFSIIHELVHIIKRSSAVCNDMLNAFALQTEEVFCNAVAGEVLVPKEELITQFNHISKEIDIEVIGQLATKFSVSKEVVCRRLYDIGKITYNKYMMFTSQIRLNFEAERELAKEYRKSTGVGIPRNIPMEMIDQNSPSLCKVFYHGFREGHFDKQDISRYLGVKQKHIDKFMWEVARW